jgi:hypothetical protein
MVKNWIILGDEAFDGSDSYGRIGITKEQQSNWQNIVMEQLNASIQKSYRVREMIENSNVIQIDFHFFVKPKVAVRDVVEFIKTLEERFLNKKIVYNISHNREFSSIFIDFWKVDFDSEDDNLTTEEKKKVKKYTNLIMDYKPGRVYKIKEPVFFPRFLKKLAFQISEPMMIVSHSISKKTMAKSLSNICSLKELIMLGKLPIFFDDTPDMDFYRMIKRIQSMRIENDISWLVIRSSDRFLKEKEQELMSLAKDFQLIVVAIGYC